MARGTGFGCRKFGICGGARGMVDHQVSIKKNAQTLQEDLCDEMVSPLRGVVDHSGTTSNLVMLKLPFLLIQPFAMIL